jgi:hypothetical protein
MRNMTLSRALLFSMLVHLLVGAAMFKPPDLTRDGQRSLEVLIASQPRLLSATPVIINGPAEPIPSLGRHQSPQESMSPHAVAMRHKVQREAEDRHAPQGGHSAMAGAVAQDDILLYRINLAREMRRLQPNASPSLIGVATFLISTVAGSSELAVALSAGSNDRVVDALALEWTRQAVRSTALPIGLQGRSFALSVTVRVGSGQD